MSDLRKHFRKLMEDVDMNYQPPVHPNSGGGLTKFSPTPASKVLKNYSVDHDFLHKALSYGNPNMQAVDQIMGAIGGTATNGVLGGQHFDDIIGSFNSPEVLGNQLPPTPEAMPPVEPIEPQGDEWVSFKDFKDAAPFVGGFVNSTEGAIFIKFPGRLPALKDACLNLGGLPVDLGLSYDLSIRFEALPRIPLLLLFNDEDDEFPAQGALLFQKKAEKYLDMECLAILGWFLTDSLLQAAGESYTTIM